MTNFFKYFDLDRGKENYQDIVTDIEKDVTFRGAHLWILIFAIFVASLGLNINSTAVIIGAMLISPLMGPIVGLGLGMGINDLALLRKSFFNYLFATAVSLATSTLYFIITPISAAHSEILARTSPTIYDVLIAFFGGLAGIVAISANYKGNVIPGVAIATALMPPLCTAGYGLATFRFAYFFGAFYLFLINSVFIALATLLTVRLLKFPYKKLSDHEAEIKARRIAWVVAIMTLLPSLYFGFDIVKQEKFMQNAERFILNETRIPDDYLLEKSVDARKKSISLTYGGKRITNAEIDRMKEKLIYYNLEQATLIIRQGFEYLSKNEQPEQANPLRQALAEKENELLALKSTMDSLKSVEINTIELVQEARALYPDLKSIAIFRLRSSDRQNAADPENDLAYLQFSKLPGKQEEERLRNWLEIKLQRKIKVVFDQ